MLAITQFEVYVLQKGRWTIHARYPGEERNQAVLDARTVESTLGFPAKVIRETYYPEVNDSERFTVYTSPKVKEQQAQLAANARRRTPLASARAAATAALKRRPRPAARPRLTASQVFFRVIVAGGISLAAATLMTGIVAWALHRAAEGGIDISASTRTTTLTYAYVVMFLFFFTSLFRSRLPLHRLLADLWQKAAQQKAAAATAAANAGPPRVKPKHNRAASPETLREWEDLKIKRGDLDPLRLLEGAQADVPAAAPEIPAPPLDQPIPASVPEQAPTADVAEAQKAEAKKKEKKEKAEKERLATEAAAAAQIAAEDEAKAKAAPEEPLRDALNLERMVMRRFAVDVVKSAIQGAMPDDPMTRRGTALVLAGGAAGVAATARLDAAAEEELLTDALQHIGMNQGAVDLFMSQRAEQVIAPANAGLLAAGRRALAAYLEGTADVAGMLARAMTHWRTPFGAHPLPEAGFGDADVNAAPLLEVYMLTELRESARAEEGETAMDAFHDQAMGAHNGIVRMAITAHGGHEVKHTGKGIFARFATARAAVNAAVDAQRAFAEQSSKLAIGLIGNTTAGEDPILSANLVHQAQALVGRAGTGEILCEAQVQAAIRRPQSAGDTASNEVTDDLDLVRMDGPEPEFESRAAGPAPHSGVRAAS